MHGIQASKEEVRTWSGRKILGVEVLDVWSRKMTDGDHIVVITVWGVLNWDLEEEQLLIRQI